MDDDVQYLGTRLAAPEPLDDPCEPHRSVVGVIFHVEKCGEKPAHDLTFHRNRSSYVNIGRKSASDDKSMRRENDDHNAVFTCQVVSARHAKLVLSDSGQVYIVDLHSRHGTHILRRGETVQRTLQAEVETLLADGDVLTFGKMVGAGSYHVCPVTVRVELLSGCLPSEPSANRALTFLNSPSPVLSRPRKLSSGRYGLISAPCIDLESSHSSSSSISVSSDVASSPSDQESDVEAEYSCVPAVIRDSQGKASVKIPAFRSFIRDIHHNAVSHPPVIPDIPAKFLEATASSSSADVVRPSSPIVVTPCSHSPIEVPTTLSPPSEAQQSEPAVIGAWPASRPESPRHSSLEVETSRSEVLPAPEPDREPEPIPAPPCTSPTRITPLSNDAFIELMHRLPPPPPFFPLNHHSGPFSSSIASDFGLPSVPHPPPHPPPPPPPPLHRIPPFHPIHKVVSECINSEIKGSLKSVEDRIVVLQEAIRELKSRQSVTEEDVIDLQSHSEMLEPESEHLLCRITGAERNIASLSTLQGQMTALQNQVTTLRGKLDTSEPRPVETPICDVRACADALNGLVSEMKALRENVEKRIESKLEAIRSARTDALKEVVAEAESVRCLKRKRGNGEAEEEAPVVVAPAACSLPPAADEALVPEVASTQVPTPQVPVSITVPEVSVAEALTLEPIRPNKRARMAVRTVAHTAAAMAIGAAATWSALAFF